MDRFTNKKVIIVVIATIVIILGCYFFFVQSEPKQAEKDPVFADIAEESTEGIKEEVDQKKPDIMKVDVKGAVRMPGVYIAKPGDRVIDVIAAAGDFTDHANVNKVNLAQLVEDQMVIYIPKVGEEEEDVSGAVLTPNQGAVTIGTDGTTSSNNTQVNLNTATQAELETLPGIGPSKATAIIEYRETTGKFQQVDDLKNISGIGDKTFDKLKDSITVH